MPKIETQGVSEDFATATGQFDPIDRGEVSRSELETILQQVVSLKMPETGDGCPPSVNTVLFGEKLTCFYGFAGVIHCTHSQAAAMSAHEAAQIICGDISLAEYDQSKGYQGARTPPVVLNA